MANSKDVITRLAVIDSMMSEWVCEYTIDEITAKVNEVLAEQGKEVSKRTIQRDLTFISEYGPFQAEFSKRRVDVETANGVVISNVLYKYKKKGYSIFRKQLTDEEKALLQGSLSFLGQFEAIPELSGLENLKATLGMKKQSAIVSFASQEVAPDIKAKTDKNFGLLYEAIYNKRVVKIQYETFKSPGLTTKIVCPYLIKEYNKRWFLLAYTYKDEDKNSYLRSVYALERIAHIDPAPMFEYIEPSESVSEWHEDSIGITLPDENAPIYRILFWVDDFSKQYVIHKPLHASQRHISNDEALRIQYPQFQGGSFFEIQCCNNYELIRELMNFGNDLVVLSPETIRDQIKEKLRLMQANYND